MNSWKIVRPLFGYAHKILFNTFVYIPLMNSDEVKNRVHFYNACHDHIGTNILRLSSNSNSFVNSNVDKNCE